MAAEANVEFEWRTYESRMAGVLDALHESGIEVDGGSVQTSPTDDPEGDAGFEPLMLVAGATAIALVARTVSRVVRDHRQGGVVIDTSDGRVSIREAVRGVNAGTVVVVGMGEPRILSAPDELTLGKL